jgi:hypothetical protein
MLIGTTRKFDFMSIGKLVLHVDDKPPQQNTTMHTSTCIQQHINQYINQKKEHNNNNNEIPNHRNWLQCSNVQLDEHCTNHIGKNTLKQLKKINIGSTIRYSIETNKSNINKSNEKNQTQYKKINKKTNMKNHRTKKQKKSKFQQQKNK